MKNPDSARHDSTQHAGWTVAALFFLLSAAMAYAAAIDLKKAGEPLDRVLRMQEIAWEEAPPRRARLEKVATRWYGYEGSFQPESLRMAVVNDCQQSAPAP